MTDKTIKFIKETRARYLIGALAALAALTSLLELTRGASLISIVVGWVVGMAIAIGAYYLSAKIFVMVVSSEKVTGSEFNSFKAFLTYGVVGQALSVVTGILTAGVGAAYVVGTTYTRASGAAALGAIGVFGGVLLLAYLGILLFFVSVIAKINQVSWLKGCLGLIISSIIIAVLVAILGFIGISGLVGVGFSAF